MKRISTKKSQSRGDSGFVRVLTIMALMLIAATGAWAQSTYTLTLAANNAQMGSVEIPRHEGNGFLFEVKAADYAGQQSSIGNYQKFYFNTPPVDENSTVWTFNEDNSYPMMVNPEGFGKDQRRQCRVVFVGPNGETYECDFKNADQGEVYLKNGNTYSDYYGNNLLWQGGVASIECYGPGMMLPDGVAQISDNTFSVLAGTKVPAKATAKLRYSFVNWSNNSTEAETTYTMPATAATLTANFAANPTLTLTASPATGGSVGFDFTPTPQTLTVNDGAATNYQVPIYMSWLDDASTRGQYIIPAEQLGLMAGSTINSITYYHGNPGEWTSSSNVNVYLKEVENTILTEYVDATTATTVYTGTLTETDGLMTITFSEPYTYNGGNLLVGFDNTAAGNFNGTGFYGVDAPSGSSAGDSNGTFTAQSFLPKSTFNYTPALPAGVIANTDGTYSVAAGTLFTLKAKPADNYTLGSWSNNAEVNDNGTQTITMGSANLTVTATFVGQPHGVKLAEGTDDADNWTAKVGDATEFTALPLKDVEEGKTVTLKYNGTKRVKSVTATSDAAPPAPKPIADVNTNDVGKLIGLDGYIYVTKSAATTAGTTAVAVIAYVGSETGDDTYKKGLAIALADESGTMNWSTAKTTCEGKTAVTNAKWCLPSVYQWRQMCKANGGNDDNCNGLYTTITTHEGTAWQSVEYWTSTEPLPGYKSYFLPTVDGSGGLEIMMVDNLNNSYYARACLVF